jgi:hypothetical protein
VTTAPDEAGTGATAGRGRTADASGSAGPVEIPLRRNRFSTPVLVVAGALLVAVPVAVAIAIAATVLSAGTNLGGVLVGLVVPLALVAFAIGVARPLAAGRRVVLVLRADALVLADRTLFRAPEAIGREVVAGAWIGEGVDAWLGGRDPEEEVALAPDDEPVDLLVTFSDLVVLDHARRKVSRPKGVHRAALPSPDRPVGHLWVPLADVAAARSALAGWLPVPPVDAPAGAPVPDVLPAPGAGAGRP